jgi:PhnB protein
MHAMTVTPYLTFNGNCEAALTFYEKALGAKIIMISRYKDMPADAERAPEHTNIHNEAGERVMHGRLQVGNQWIMASDCPPNMPYKGIEGVSIALGFDDVNEAERVFTALSEGAQVNMPLGETFWAERFGMLTDKFGVDWMVNGIEKTRP